MRYIVLLILILATNFPLKITLAQDDCDVSAIRAEFAAQLETAQTVDQLVKLNNDLRVALSTCEDGPRTYYETLDLTSPEAALATFMTAFQHDDYATVFLVLAPRSQFAWTQTFSLLRYGDLIQEERWSTFKDEVPLFTVGVGHFEHMDSEYAMLFDALMLAASNHDALLIDLRGTYTVLSSQTSDTELEKIEGDVIDILVEVENIDEPVIFRMVQAPSGRWRVHQVIVEGGNEDQIPWSVVTD